MPKGIYKDKTKYVGGKKGRKYSWGKGKTQKGRIFTLEHIENMRGKVRSQEHKLAISKANSGEKSHFWIKDRTQLKKDVRRKDYDTQYKYWMLGVKKRDGWKCRISNSDCKGRMEAHHILNWIDYPELRYEINNGITLCHAHHPRKRMDETNLSLYFKELVMNIK